MARLLSIWRSWSVRTRVLVAGGAVLLVAGGALAAYLVLKREGDVQCPPPCELERQEPVKERERIKTVNWPMYGYDQQRTRYLPTERVKPPYGSSEWSLQVGKLIEFSPIVVKGTLYFQDKNAEFYALNARTGKVKWQKDIGNLGAASPAYSHGRVYAVSLDPGSAIAMRARDGKILWERPLSGRSETSPIVVGKNVVVGSESGTVYSLDRENGQIEWQIGTDGAVKGGLALKDGVLYGANYAGQVFALRASNGSFVWQSSTQGLSFGRGGPVYSTPAVAFGRVYLGSIDGRVYSFDEDNGELLWSHSTGDWVYAGPAVADTKRSDPTVYVGSKDQNFYALDAETGDVRWQKDLGGIVLGAATVLGEVVYVAGIGPNIGTFGFDVKTGKNVFESELGEYNPVISDGNRMYLTGTSNVRAFEHQTKADRRRIKQRLERQAEKKRERKQRQRKARDAKLERQRKAHAEKQAEKRPAKKDDRKPEQRGNKGDGSGGNSG